MYSIFWLSQTDATYKRLAIWPAIHSLHLKGVTQRAKKLVISSDKRYHLFRTLACSMRSTRLAMIMNTTQLPRNFSAGGSTYTITLADQASWSQTLITPVTGSKSRSVSTQAASHSKLELHVCMPGVSVHTYFLI